MELERDIEIAENYAESGVRMRGGADTEELKEILKDSPSDGEIPPKTQGVDRESYLFEKPVLSKKGIAFKYIKMSVLVLIVLIAIVLLARVKEHETNFQLIAIATNEKQNLIDISSPKENLWGEEEIGVQMRGPFLAHEPIHDDNKNPTLTVYISEGADQERISETETYLLKKPTAFDEAHSELKTHVFHLHKSAKKRKEVFLTLITKNLNTDFGVELYVNTSPIITKTSLIFGTIILIFLYFAIVTEVVDRTFAALVCAALSISALALYDSRPTANDIIRWIDVDTLTLLVGMMILVAILAESGIFDYFAVFAYKVAKGRPWPLINCLCFFTAVLATFLDSVTMMLLATPVTIRLCEVLSLDPVPILICMVIFANVGAAVTPVGDPPNVIISLNPVISASNVNFGSFFLHMFPGVVLALIQCYIHIRLLFRKPQSLRFKETNDLKNIRQEIATWERTAAAISPYSQDEDIARETINEKIAALKKKLADAEASEPNANKEPPSFEETLAELTALYPLRDKMLLIKAGVTFIFILVLFLGHSIPGMGHVSLGWSALLGALLLLILADKRDLETILVRVEWSTLLFFASLFIVMESLADLGVIDVIGKFVTNVILSVEEKYRLLLAIIIVLWVTAIASAFLDNIPVTTMMIKIIINLSQDAQLKLPLHPLVWSLAFGACFGGNGTLIGASANVVTAGVSEQHGYKITFLKFFIVCFPIMLGSVAIANVYLLIAHVAFQWHDD